MKRVVVGGTVVAAFCGASALAADLPTKAPPTPAPGTSCFANFSDYINSSAQDCPLSWSGITLYGAIDIGAGYVTHGVPFNGAYPQGIEPLISKNSQGARFSIAPNGLGQSVVGIKGTEEFAQGTSFVFKLETGFDPYSMQLANGPRSLIENNGSILANQSANGNSSRAGQAFNSEAYAGFSNTTFGTLTSGRLNSLTLDTVTAYDPMGGPTPSQHSGLPAKLSASATPRMPATTRRSSIWSMSANSGQADCISLAAIAKATAPMELMRRRSAATLSACRSTRSIAM